MDVMTRWAMLSALIAGEVDNALCVWHAARPGGYAAMTDEEADASIVVQTVRPHITRAYGVWLTPSQLAGNASMDVADVKRLVKHARRRSLPAVPWM